jgi:hypothetical protein
MIDNAIKFIASEVNKYVVRKIDPQQDPSITKLVVAGNVVKTQDGEAGSNPLLGKGILTLVNIEEDRISKSPQNFRKLDGLVEYRNPKIFLNLYCLFSVFHNSYETALQYLSLIIQFFQFRNLINHQNSPSSSEPKLHPNIEQLVFDMVSMNFEQVNHLWGTLGGKYLPSVLYKVRLVAIEDDTPESVGPPITNITINPTTLNS